MNESRAAFMAKDEDDELNPLAYMVLDVLGGSLELQASQWWQCVAHVMPGLSHEL